MHENFASVEDCEKDLQEKKDFSGVDDDTNDGDLTRMSRKRLLCAFYASTRILSADKPSFYGDCDDDGGDVKLGKMRMSWVQDGLSWSLMAIMRGGL